MVKISQLPLGTAPGLTDPVPNNESSTTKRTLWSSIRDLFFKNIPTTAVGGMFDHVISGGVWSGDSYGSTLNGSMTAIICRIGGVYTSVGAVTAHAFTASKDTYIDILSNGDGTGSVVYTEVSNNAASPALAGSSLRIAIIVTGASNIASAGSVNQGQENKVLPIASSIPYQVTDSLGNLICPRDPSRQIIGYRQITSNATQTGGDTLIPGLTVPVIIPTGRKVIVTFHGSHVRNSTANTSSTVAIWEGSVGGTSIRSSVPTSATANANVPFNIQRTYTPSSTSVTYNASLANVGGGTATLIASSTDPAFVQVELK